MLPIIQIINFRYFNGELVYKIIPEIWGGMQPIYLPSMWIPYASSVWMNFDPSWNSFLLLILGTSIFIYKDLKNKNFLGYLPFLSLAIFFILKMIVKDNRILTMIEELVVVFY